MASRIAPGALWHFSCLWPLAGEIVENSRNLWITYCPLPNLHIPAMAAFPQVKALIHGSGEDFHTRNK
ncbi:MULTISPECIES: hypothetical protein [Corynebacterium]|uniref:Uncharacterized protein n=1 Tax=Corynebacterium phoceense TaxID=1686286 RepID=A0A540R855_9CORY|nr:MULTISPECIES: hypothetical protein [Corynebacterium]KXB52596.1 hypothetical protein HMPREF0307_02176 [Corynebacterium sp. DNF00584]MBF9012043.1 hypothetical protein [Corynebacterium phoceense]MCQ9344885.1 hypothetical protein [Corynebacterium phoceense]TQE43920.1 hypothetical protein EJK80_05165 [Corynebacterium phoceense]